MKWVNFLLLLVAVILLGLLAPFGIIATLIASVGNRDAIRPLVYLSQTAYLMAYAIDLLGNVLAKDLFNGFLIRPDGYRFGVVGETISSVLGKNMLNGTLTGAGKTLCRILDFFDENHCLNAIQPQFGM